jgi:predicted transcriptional regulator
MYKHSILVVSPMTVKEQVRLIAEQLPTNATIEDAIEQLLFLYRVEYGLQQADEGNTLSHEAVLSRILQWHA